MRLNFQETGSGPPVVLLHGFPLDRSIWSPEGPFRWILPDLRGHGRSPTAPTATMEEQAQDVLELLDALKIDRAAVGGHSMGGYVLFALHRLAPDRLRAGLFIATRSAADSEEGRRGREQTALRILKEGPGFLAASMGDRLFAADDSPHAARLRDIISRTDPQGIAAALRGMAARPDATPQLAAFQAPALVIAGRGDRIVPAAESEAMARAMPRARLEFLERSGHMPMLEEAGRFRTVLVDFLSGLHD